MEKLRFVVLDFYRFIFAIIVVGYHYGGNYALPNGYLCVDFFFILSGFVLNYAFVDKITNSEDGYSKFIIARFARLYPLHLFTLIIMLIITIAVYSHSGRLMLEGVFYADGYIYSFLANLFLMQSSGLLINHSWNVPSWSLSVEWIANLFIFLIPALSQRRSRSWIMYFAIAMSGYLVLSIEKGSLFVFDERLLGFFNGGLVRGFAGVALGALCYEIFCVLKFNDSTFTKNVITTLKIVMTISLVALFVFFHAVIKNSDFVFIILVAVFIVVTACFEKIIFLEDYWIGKLMGYVGAISYSVYMCHWIALVSIKEIIRLECGINIDDSDPWIFLLYIGLTISMSIMTYHFVEMPSKKYIMSYFRGNKR